MKSPTAVKPLTINQIQADMRASGSHWWDAETMQSFGTVPDRRVYYGPGGVFFVTEDDRFDRSRGWTVRHYTGDIETAGDLCEYPSLAEARKAARTFAGSGTYTEDGFRPIKPIDDFQAALAAHTGVRLDLPTLRYLMVLAGRHHRGAEKECNEGGDHTTTVEGEIKAWLRKHLPKVKAHFSGDPRGVTVKLIFPDGATNDWGQTGWCVPTFGE